MNQVAVRAAAAVAAIYGFFLIFAQFSFIELLRGSGFSQPSEKAILGIMAVAGIAGGFLAAWRGVSTITVRSALVAAALASALAPMAHGMPGAVLVALVTGISLGIATVGLSALLPTWCGTVWVGLGTGLGYAICNLPVVFQQTPANQAWIGAGFACLGALVIPPPGDWPARQNRMIFPAWGAVAIFTALVWMDSAAFFIIQHSMDLKSGTWGDPLLWRNAWIHLVLGLAAGIWLDHRGARSLPGLAWILLAVAALAVNHEQTRGIAGWLYPAGVSLYSAALVVWPGWFSGAGDSRAAAWKAAWMFGIAGWFGSANGIGMAQKLQQVPPAFVIAAGIVVIGVMILSDFKSWRCAVAAGVIILIAVFSNQNTADSVTSSADRGRQVYLSEGCIHCHSQYSRPDSPDESIWGPAREVRKALAGSPVLIGNRRQGPDLTNVGARRSEAWLKAHFIDPRALAPDSSMPSYAHLFESGRGDDLVRYLKESGVGATGALMETQSRWQPAGSPAGINAHSLYSKHCAVCHGAFAGGFGPLAGSFARPPTNLKTGPFIWTNNPENPRLTLQRVIKFGIIGTDMPGHETLPDAEIAALAELLIELR